MKIKVKNISGVEKAIQLDGINYKTVKPEEVVEREFVSEKHIPEGWAVVKADAPTAPAPGRPKGRNSAPAITENNQNPTTNDSGVTTSAALKHII